MSLSSPPELPSGFLLHLAADPIRAADLDAAVARAPSPAIAGRVTRAERGGAEVLTSVGSRSAIATDPVCTGDWVVVSDVPPGGDDRPEILEVLPRGSVFVRQAASGTSAQVLAANIDEVWLVVPLDRPVSAARLERTMVLAWESGAEPVVVATKTDAAGDTLAEAVAAIASAAPGSPLLTVSTVTGEGLAELVARLPAGRTAALLGASGAGKSSLVNALAGGEVAAVGAVRAADGKGRHTTSWRHLEFLPDGGAVMDTPGLRAVGMWIDEGGIDAAFADITELAAACRFSDCAHRSEPDCAVQAAIADGRLPARRLDSYRKLQAEAAFAEQRNDARAAAAARRVWAARSKESKDRVRRR